MLIFLSVIKIDMVKYGITVQGYGIKFLSQKLMLYGKGFIKIPIRYYITLTHKFTIRNGNTVLLIE